MTYNSLFGLVLALVAGLLVIWLLTSDAISLSDGDPGQLVYSIVLLGLVGGAALVHFRQSLGQAAAAATLWGAAFFAIVLGYSYRDDLGVLFARVGAELAPSAAQETGPGEVVFRMRSDGHFAADASVNGAPVRFLVDTGASVVTLTQSDARRAGIKTRDLDYRLMFQTANGKARGAPVILEEIAVGSIVKYDVPAAVMHSGLETSLLGVSFLRRLESYSVSGDTLTLIDGAP